MADETKEVVETKEEKIETPTQIGDSAPEKETKNIGEDEVTERDKARMEVEDRVFNDQTPLPPEIKEETKKPETVEEVKEEIQDPTERLKAKIQKRIGKEVAKRKTLEEQLAEKEAEIERLKSTIKEPDGKSDTKKDREPTQSEIASALKKAREDGDTEFEVQILDYIAEKRAKAERKQAEDNFAKNQSQITERQRNWAEIVRDYTVFDDNGKEVKDHPLNLNNENSQLYKTANALYLDPDLRKDRYSRGTEMENLRRAISDAYMELSKIGIEKKTEIIEDGKSAKERKKIAPAEPSATPEEPSEVKSMKPKTDTENVQDEVKNRMKFRRARESALI